MKGRGGRRRGERGADRVIYYLEVRLEETRRDEKRRTRSEEGRGTEGQPRSYPSGGGGGGGPSSFTS